MQIFNFSILKPLTVRTFLMFCLLGTSQQMFAQWLDDFADGNFSANPMWVGSDTEFTVESGELRLLAPAVAGQSYLSVASKSIQDASWEFTIRMNFNPSSSNYARVYVVASGDVLVDTLSGYFVMIGNTADEISLYKQTGSTRTKIIDGVDGRINAAVVNVRIKLTRTAFGEWHLYSDVGVTGAFTSEGSVVDADHVSSRYVGVFCNYTATRSDKFYFDDFVVTGSPYVPPPPPLVKDVIISEIFADPSPRVELPDYEFVELFNRSNRTYNLNGWSLSDGSSGATLPSIELHPGEYLIVTSTAAGIDYSTFGRAVGVSNFPSLNNGGDPVALRYRNGMIIDSVFYSSQWFQNKTKGEGGWSLEIIDPSNICSEESNWIASESEQGGTPGQQNSVIASKPDLMGPRMIRAIATNDVEISLVFDEKLGEALPSIQDFTIQPAITISSVRFSDRSLRKIFLTVAEPVQPRVLYTVTARGVYDCAGNAIRSDFSSIEFGLPESADSLDVVINEILFNPNPTGVDFVEIFNRSDKFINLKNWSLANVENGAIENSGVITTGDFLFFPKSYLVLTENADVLAGEYPQTILEKALQIESLPPMNDDAGTILLQTDSSRVIDNLTYSKDFHSVFIDDEEGVSLERIYPEGPTNDPENWKSASSVSGFATPGFLNSNAREKLVLPEDAVQVSPEIFIPMSGQPDFTEIVYHFDQGGYVGNVKIYDAEGRLIKQLANNELLGAEGSFRWDGEREDGSKARIGYYVVWVQVFNADGNVNTFRKRLAIAGEF